MMISAEEHERINWLAKKARTDASTYVRGLIKSAYFQAHVRRAEGPSTEAARNKAIRGAYLKELVTFAEEIDRALDLWREGRHDQAIDLAATANFIPRVPGKLSKSAWADVFRDHAANQPGKRAKSTLMTTNQIVLSLIDWGESGDAYPTPLSDGKTMLRRRTLETALGKRKGRRREPS